jgi:hypothetical protein
MSFQLRTGGTRYNLATGNCVPKRATAAYLAAAIGTPPASAGPPLVGHLLKYSTAGNDQVDHCVVSDLPVAFVFHLNSGNGILSVVELRTCEIDFEYNVAAGCVIGNQIQANGTLGTIPIGGFLFDQVKGVVSGGVGLVVDKDEVQGIVTVRFP